MKIIQGEDSQFYDKVINCNICGTCFKMDSNYSELKNHIAKAHGGGNQSKGQNLIDNEEEKSKLKCYICKSAFSEPSILDKHITSAHELIHTIFKDSIGKQQVSKGKASKIVKTSFREKLFQKNLKNKKEVVEKIKAEFSSELNDPLALGKHDYTNEEKEDIIEKYLYAKHVNDNLTMSIFLKKLSHEEEINIDISMFSKWLKEKGITIEKDFKCDLCSDKFEIESQLKKHIKVIHSEEQVFSNEEKAKIIQRYFEERYNNRYFRAKTFILNLFSEGIKIHKELLTKWIEEEGPYKFKCHYPNCPKKFKRKSHLQEHIVIIHEDNKPFHCNICKISFPLKKNLNSHNRRKHEN